MRELHLSKRRRSNEITNDAIVKINSKNKTNGEIKIGAVKLKSNLLGNLSNSTLSILKNLKIKKPLAPSILNQDI